MENQDSGALIAIVLSAKETVRAEDFSCLQKFRSLFAERTVTPILLYCGQSIQTFDGLGAAVPIAFLWR